MTTSYELSLKLAKAFPEMVTEKDWYTEGSHEPFVAENPVRTNFVLKRICIAPNSDELLEMLPKKWRIELIKTQNGNWSANFSPILDEYGLTDPEYNSSADTPAEALGELLLKLREEGLV